MTCKILAFTWMAFTLAGADLGKAPADFKLTDAKGATISAAKYRGRVVLINFWATWCHGCKEELPWLVQYQRDYRRKGLTLIGISMDEDGWKAVRPFLKKTKLNYPVVIGNEQLAQKYGLEAMPMTVLIGRDGTVAAAYAGVVDRAGCERQIRELLGRAAIR